MSDTQLSERLYQILPAVYRNRDDGDLEAYLAGCGDLLQQLLATLEQRLADNFPDNPIDEQALACQDWVLPYFADLLDARLVSPHPQGRRDEIAQAIAWRQRKGTVAVIESVSHSVAQAETVVQEGWQRVAVTPRIAKALQPASALGVASEPTSTHPSIMSRHPELPAVTVDFRCPSQAVLTDADNPAATLSVIDGSVRFWRSLSQHGVPCHPGHYDDVSRRTVDVRTPSFDKGHHHPLRVLVFLPPALGWFRPNPITVNWDNPLGERFQQNVEVDNSISGVTVYRNRRWRDGDFTPVTLRRIIELGVGGGGAPDFHVYRFEGFELDNRVVLHAGRLELERCAVRTLEIRTEDLTRPVLEAKDCLFNDVDANSNALLRCEYCTFIDPLVCGGVEASDCIFLNGIYETTGAPSPPSVGCIRYSRIERHQTLGSLSNYANTREPAVFVNDIFGQRGCAVLHPQCPHSVRFGAEDGGEMGAYHYARHTLAEQGLLDKLKEFLPVGIEAVLIRDPHMLDVPAQDPSAAGPESGP